MLLSSLGRVGLDFIQFLIHLRLEPRRNNPETTDASTAPGHGGTTAEVVWSLGCWGCPAWPDAVVIGETWGNVLLQKVPECHKVLWNKWIRWTLKWRSKVDNLCQKFALIHFFSQDFGWKRGNFCPTTFLSYFRFWRGVGNHKVYTIRCNYIMGIDYSPIPRGYHQFP